MVAAGVEEAVTRTHVLVELLGLLRPLHHLVAHVTQGTHASHADTHDPSAHSETSTHPSNATRGHAGANAHGYWVKTKQAKPESCHRSTHRGGGVEPFARHALILGTSVHPTEVVLLLQRVSELLLLKLLSSKRAI
jgi:hypothetical protein